MADKAPMLSIDLSADGKINVRYPTMFEGGPVNEMLALYLVERLRMFVEDQVRKAAMQTPTNPGPFLGTQPIPNNPYTRP